MAQNGGGANAKSNQVNANNTVNLNKHQILHSRGGQNHNYQIHAHNAPQKKRTYD